MTEKQFIMTYCYNCGTQRCEGIGTEWFEGCPKRWNLDGYGDAAAEIERLNKKIIELGTKILKLTRHGEWIYWDGLRGNHDQRIEDATCSKCGYIHHTVRR